MTFSACPAGVGFLQSSVLRLQVQSVLADLNPAQKHPHESAFAARAVLAGPRPYCADRSCHGTAAVPTHHFKPGLMGGDRRGQQKGLGAEQSKGTTVHSSLALGWKGPPSFRSCHCSHVTGAVCVGVMGI